MGYMGPSQKNKSEPRTWLSKEHVMSKHDDLNLDPQHLKNQVVWPELKGPETRRLRQKDHWGLLDR